MSQAKLYSMATNLEGPADLPNKKINTLSSWLLIKDFYVLSRRHTTEFVLDIIWRNAKLKLLFEHCATK